LWWGSHGGVVQSQSVGEQRHDVHAISQSRAELRPAGVLTVCAALPPSASTLATSHKHVDRPLYTQTALIYSSRDGLEIT